MSRYLPVQDWVLLFQYRTSHDDHRDGNKWISWRREPDDRILTVNEAHGSMPNHSSQTKSRKNF